jgi:hypothetical protein
MGACARGCTSIFFTILTVITIGGILAILIAALILFEKYKLVEYDNRLLVFLIIALVVAILVFIFGLYVSCLQKVALRTILTIVFLVVDLAVLALAVFVFVGKDSIISSISGLWSLKRSSDLAIVVALQDAFTCCGWEGPGPNCTTTNPPCKEVIEPDFDKNAKVIGGALLGFGVLLLLGVILAFKLVCCGKADDDDDQKSLSQSNYTAPLNDDSNKSTAKYSW